jgi:protein pelota
VLRLRIINKDLRYGRIRMYVDTMDDLWYLKNVIRENDQVRMLSFRSREEASDKLREKKSEKVPMLITIEVESVEFHPFSNYLRIKGRITEAPEAVGEYHTLTVQPGSDLTVIKDWQESELSLIKEAEESSRRAKLIIVSIDDEEATIALVRAYGIERLASISSGRSGKQYESREWQREFFGEAAAEVGRRMEEGTRLAVVGPGFVKDSFADFLKGKGTERVLLDSTSDEGMNGVVEAIKKGVLKRAESEARVAEEYELIDELLSLLRRDPELCALGDNAIKALELGAAETLLILDERLRDSRDAMELAKKTGCRVRIISSEHDAGVTLRSFGGIAAMLRYRL